MEFVEPIRDKNHIEKIKQYLKERSLRDYVLFVLGINTGIRVTDLIKLKVIDALNRDFVQISGTKRKMYCLSKPLQQIICDYVEKLSLSKDDWLFPSRKGGFVSRYRVWRIINQAAHKAAGIDTNGYRIGANTMRKTFGYHAYMAGVDISIIRDILEQRSSGGTLKYIGINKGKDDKKIKNLNL